MRQYLVEQDTNQLFGQSADCPVELISQKDKNQILRR